MTNKDILSIALQQSAYDSGCLPEDFLSEKNKIVISKKNERARKYLSLPFYCDLTSYGNCIVASVCPELKEITSEYINKYAPEHCFETPNLIAFQKMLRKYDMNVCFMAEYFLPDLTLIKALPCEYEIKLLKPDDFKNLYTKEWSNALCEKRKNLDVLAAAAYENNKIVGMAGCSADCSTMWQIGVDVLPEYRLKGIASALTSTLAMEVLKRDKVPFYCCAWSNLKSARNAVRSGFKPAWVQLTVKKNDFIDKINA